jgi:hypothetical protein
MNPVILLRFDLEYLDYLVCLDYLDYFLSNLIDSKTAFGDSYSYEEDIRTKFWSVVLDKTEESKLF